MAALMTRPLDRLAATAMGGGIVGSNTDGVHVESSSTTGPKLSLRQLSLGQFSLGRNR